MTTYEYIRPYMTRTVNTLLSIDFLKSQLYSMITEERGVAQLGSAGALGALFD